jgi:hypothetical protein
MKCGYNAHLLGQVRIVVVLTPLMLAKTPFVDEPRQ